LEQKEWLFEILKDMKMVPRYVLEDYPTFGEKHLILMKCFCDIPLSNINNHTNTYGKYGIGLSKEFAFRNFISPVQYFHRHSDPVLTLMSLDFKNNYDFDILIPYLKYMYSNDNKTYYYEEREWRYISGRPVNVTSKFETEINQIRENLNKDIQAELKIEFTDIEYIFLANQDDVLILLNEIEKMSFSRLEKNILISKIVTITQIENDF
jgi:hypothetical protein